MIISYDSLGKVRGYGWTLTEAALDTVRRLVEGGLGWDAAIQEVSKMRPEFGTLCDLLFARYTEENHD